MKKFYLVAAFLITVVATMVGTGWAYRTHFEAISGVNWYSFEAAHDDCVANHQEKCKIFGGFAPESQFR